MLPRVLLVCSVLLGGALTGCLSSEEPPAEVATDKPGGEDGVIDANESTVAPDGRGEISAFKETNRTEMGTGGMEHTHDYWQGKDRIETVAWINSGLIPFPLTPCKKSDGSCTVGGGGETYPAGTAIADYDLAPYPDMGMIYEGTKQVELVLVAFDSVATGTPPNPLGKVYFDYLAANDEPGAFRTGGELKLNEPFLIDIKATDADMPHQTKSLWVFRIYSNSEMITFGFNISINLIRGYDVVNWPPHPDLYADKSDRVVYEGAVSLASKGTIDSNIYGTDAGWLNPEKVISWGTDRLDITVTNVRYTSTTTIQPSSYVFEFHNASKPPLLGHGAQYGGRLSDPGSDGSTFFFTIDLTQDRGDAMDTPYGQYSRWGFRLVPQFDQAGAVCVDNGFLQQILVGCQFVPWEMTYDMKIVAYGHSTATEIRE